MVPGVRASRPLDRVRVRGGPRLVVGEGRPRPAAAVTAVRRKAKDPADGVARADGAQARRHEGPLGPVALLGRVGEAAAVAARERPVQPPPQPSIPAANSARIPAAPARAFAGAQRPVGAGPVRKAAAAAARGPARVVGAAPASPGARAAIAAGIDLGAGAPERLMAAPPVVGAA